MWCGVVVWYVVCLVCGDLVVWRYEWWNGGVVSCVANTWKGPGTYPVKSDAALLVSPCSSPPHSLACASLLALRSPPSSWG